MIDQSVTIVEKRLKSINIDRKILKKENIVKVVKYNTITVFGFISSRFDSNLFKEYFIYDNSLIGRLYLLKQLILQSCTTKTKLRFIDEQSFQKEH